MPRYSEEIFKKKVIEAVEAGNKAALKTLIKDHKDEASEAYRVSLLMKNSVKRRVRFSDEDNVAEELPLLYMEADYGDIVSVLLQEGAEPNKIVQNGKSPFRHVVLKGYIRSVKVMLNGNKMPNGIPLSDYVDNIEMVLTLIPYLDKTALADQLNKVENEERLRTYGYQLLQQYVEGKEVEALQQEYADLKAFSVACQAGNADAMQLLLAKGVSASDTLIDKEITPMMLAARQSSVSMLAVLMHHGAVVTEEMVVNVDEADIEVRHAFKTAYYDTLSDADILFKKCFIKPDMPDVEIDYLLKRFEDRYVELVDGKTTLYHEAVSCPALLEQILLTGVEVDLQGYTGDTALHLALYRRKYKSIELLIQAEADTELANNKGKLPLHYLVGLEGQEDIYEDDAYRQLVNYLAAENPAIINKLYCEGRSLLVQMVKARNARCFVVAAMEGVDPNVVDAEGMSPLMAVVVDMAEGDEWENADDLKDELDKLKKPGFNFDLESEQHGTVFHRAVASGNEKFVKVMFAHKTKRSLLIRHEGKTPLQFAVERGMGDIVEAELKQAQENDDMDLLASYYDALGDDGLLKLLGVEYRPACLDERFIAYKTDLSEFTINYLLDRFNENPEKLWLGAELCPVLVSKLVERDPLIIDIVDATNDGRTLLHLAILAGSEDVFNLLKEKGADVTIKDNEGRLPIAGGPNIFYGSRKGAQELVQYLLGDSAVIGINEPINKNGGTLLLEALRVGNTLLAKVLIENFNADINAVDDNGDTALKLAAQWTASFEDDEEETVRLRQEMYRLLLDRVVAAKVDAVSAVIHCQSDTLAEQRAAIVVLKAEIKRLHQKAPVAPEGVTLLRLVGNRVSGGVEASTKQNDPPRPASH